MAQTELEQKPGLQDHTASRGPVSPPPRSDLSSPLPLSGFLFFAQST